MARKARTKNPRHKWESRAYHILLHPTAEQAEQLWQTCHGCWHLRALFVNDRDQNRKDNRDHEETAGTLPDPR